MSDAAEEAKVELNTAIAVYQWMREVCSTKLLSTPIKLGGPGVVVQIDESLMRHKPKVCMNSRNIDGLMLTSCVLAFSTTEDKPPAKRSGYLLLRTEMHTRYTHANTPQRCDTTI